MRSEAVTHKAGSEEISTTLSYLKLCPGGLFQEGKNIIFLQNMLLKCMQYLFTADILPSPALATPPARTRLDSVAFMEVEAAVLLVAEDVVLVVRLIVPAFSSPSTMVEPVLLRARIPVVPFCC